MDQTLQKEILSTLGLDELETEDQNELLDRIGSLVVKEALLSALEELPEEHVPAYTELLEKSSDPDELFLFCQEHIPLFEEKVFDIAHRVCESLHKQE